METIQRRETKFKAVVDHTVGAAVFSGDKKAHRAFKKLIRDLD